MPRSLRTQPSTQSPPVPAERRWPWPGLLLLALACLGGIGAGEPPPASALPSADASPRRPGGPVAPPRLEPSPLERVLRQTAAEVVFQDRDGLLFIGTREGLVRWDGDSARYWHSLPFEPDSLLHNTVVAIDQDHEGHFWVRSRVSIHAPSRVSRLVAPDLDRFVHYPGEGQTLAMDPAGEPWLIDARGVHRYRRDQDRFEPWITRDGEGDAPTATPTLAIARGTSRRAAIDDRGTLWISSHRGLERCRLAARACRTFPLALSVFERRYLAVDRGQVRISSAGGLACVEDDGSDRAPRIGPCRELEGWNPGSPVSAATRDADGRLWLATLDGVWLWSEAGPIPVAVEHGSGTAGDDVYFLFGDQAGGMWACTPWRLLRFDPHRQPFELLSIAEGDGSPRPPAPVMALHEDDDGTLWVGTIGDGLHVRDSDGRWRHFPESLWARGRRRQATFVWSIVGAGGHVWLGTSYGLVRLDPATGRTEVIPFYEPEESGADAPDGTDVAGPERTIGNELEAPGSDVPKVVVDPDDPLRLWFANRLGDVYRLDLEPASLSLVPLSSASPPTGRPRRVLVGDGNEAQTLLVRGPREIWLGMAADGLRRFDPTTGAVRAFRHDPTDPTSLAGRGVFGLLLDAEGRLWIGTTRGLDRLSADGERFEHVLGPEDLPSSGVLGILEGPRRLWLSTNRGLVSLERDRPKGPERAPPRRAGLATWTLEDGVGNLEFDRGAQLRDRAGRLLFGGDRGITRFDPRAIRPSTYSPPIRLDRVTVVDRHGTRALALDPPRGAGAEKALELGPGVTSFTVELGTIDFGSPPANRFAVRLEGIDPGWIELGRRRSATYAAVPPGRYVLRGRVTNADGVWSTEELAIGLVIVPPFYRTALFRLAFSLGLVGLVLGLGAVGARSRYRRRYRLQLAHLEAERRREEDRRRISRDLHDDLGAGLTQIVLLSEKALRRPSEGPEGLQNIADGARRLIGAIREIIWSIDPKHDRLDRLGARLRSNAAEMLEAADLRAELDFPDTLPDRPVPPQVRRNLSLVLREAVHNAIRHADARTVAVRFAAVGDSIELEVRDDGQGFAFDPELGSGSNVAIGLGLRSIHERATAIGGSAEIAGRPHQGTTVRVRVPIEQPAPVEEASAGGRAIDEESRAP